MASSKKNAKDESEQPQADKITINRNPDHQIPLNYANFCAVSGTPEEVILELGTMEMGSRDKANVQSRTVMNYQNAQRLAVALDRIVRMRRERIKEREAELQKGLPAVNVTAPEERDIQ